MIKIPSKLGIQGNFLNLIKNIFQKKTPRQLQLIINITFASKKFLKAFPLRLKYEAKSSSFNAHFQHCSRSSS